MFEFNLSDELRFKIKKLVRKDKKRVGIINKKIKQIISCDKVTINYYKNLRNEMKEYKRVPIDSSFVLVFSVNLRNNSILFVDLDHHDRIYGKS